MDKWTVREKNFNWKRIKKYESIICQGNGYMGVRNSFEEKYGEENRATLINGVFDTPHGEVSELAVLPDVTNCEIVINGEKFSMVSGEIREYLRELNLKNGESVRSLIWKSPNGVKVKFEFRRFVSDVKKHIIAQKIRIIPYVDAKINIVSGIDGKVTNTGVQHFGVVESRSYGDNQIGMKLETLQSKVGVAIYSSINCDCEHSYRVVADRRSVSFCLEMDISEGKSVTIEKISSYATVRDFEYKEKSVIIQDVMKDGKRFLEDAIREGYDRMLKESEASWENFWAQKEISIVSSDEFYAKAINFALYHLKIMVNSDDNRLGIGAKALSGEGYKGHSYWDTEIFILPYYIFNEPRIARNLLEYRYKLLGKACEKARRYGYEGAMYPWECAWITDGETCPDWGDMDLGTGVRRRNLMAETEIHISADIVYGIWQYYCVTGDKEFMQACGYEIIFLTAIFWASRVNEVNGRYEILDVIGPDEYKDGVNNNAFTNYMARFNMQLALETINELSPQTIGRIEKRYQIKAWEEKIRTILSKFYIPEADDDGIIPQFDGCGKLRKIDTSQYKNKDIVGTIFLDYPYSEIAKMQVYKQADFVMLLYMFEELFAHKEIVDNFIHYEEKTLHDSSLSMCIHALVAARLGMNDMAMKLFKDCCSVDVGEEINNSDEGIHSASIGGIWLALAMGFGGVRISKDGISVDPILPKGIDEYSFPLVYKDTRLRITVTGKGVDVVRECGEAVCIKICGNEQKI